jgi:two-component system CheB/CheR fusion protein
VSIPKEIILMDADATRLEQVVGNLLNNAIKYTGKNGQIGVALEREGHEAVIRVKDTGIGIEPMLLKNVFDLFTQADKSLERAEGGLGIGLALVKSLTEMHGGTVEAHSRLHEGSEFVVRLPVQPPLPAPHTLPEPAAVTCERCGEPRPLRILVVDDNVAVARMSAVLLRTLGYDVKASHSGMAALELAVSFKPQVVLLDIGMPEMDGYEVARRFRAHPDLKDVRLVAVTGYGQESDRLRSKEAGFNNHLVKPVEVEELLEAVAC